jgi:hypothetical protein
VKILSFSFCLYGALLFKTTSICDAQQATNATNAISVPTPAVPSYNHLVAAARKAIDEGRLQDGLVASLAAMATDDSRFEAYAVAVLVKIKQGQPDEAQHYLAEAIKRAPQDKLVKLNALGKLVIQKTPTNVTAQVAPTVNPSVLSPEALREYEVLKQIAADAEQASDSNERKKYLEEFLEKSGVFLQENSNSIPVWTLRGLAAVELVKPKVAWISGRTLLALGAGNDAKAGRLMAQLDRKGWLGEQDPESMITKKLISEVCGKWRLMNNQSGRQIDKLWRGEILISTTDADTLRISGDFDCYSEITSSSGSLMKWRDSGSIESSGKPQFIWRNDGTCLLTLELNGKFRSNLDSLFGKASDFVTDMLELESSTGELYWPGPEDKRRVPLDPNERNALFVHGKEAGQWRKCFYLRRISDENPKTIDYQKALGFDDEKDWQAIKPLVYRIKTIEAVKSPDFTRHLKKAQEDLRKVLTKKQENSAIELGLLP